MKDHGIREESQSKVDDSDGASSNSLGYQQVLLAVLSGALVAYFLNLITSQLQLSITIGEVFGNESLDALFALLVVGLAVVILLFLPTLVIQRVLMKTTGEKLGLVGILFDIIISVLLAFFLLFLVLTLISLVVDLVSKDGMDVSDSWESFISMITYYLFTSFIASYIIWKRRLLDKG